MRKFPILFLPKTASDHVMEDSEKTKRDLPDDDMEFDSSRKKSKLNPTSKNQPPISGSAKVDISNFKTIKKYFLSNSLAPMPGVWCFLRIWTLR
jgi:hypothetical protein